MKRIIQLTESQIKKLINNIILESDIPALKIEDFKKISGYELINKDSTIEYILKGIEPDKKGNYKSRFMIRFDKNPKNNTYVVLIASVDDTKLTIQMTSYLDDMIVGKMPQLDTIENREAIIGFITYYVNPQDLNQFKEIINDFMNKNKL